MGLEWTDKWLMKVSELTGKPIPESLEKERGRLVDMITDSHTWLHGKRFALWGDPDFVMGLTKFLLELGAEPTHVLCHNGNKRWRKEMLKFSNRPTSARRPRSTSARTCGTCVRWSSPTSPTS